MGPHEIDFAESRVFPNCVQIYKKNLIITHSGLSKCRQSSLLSEGDALAAGAPESAPKSYFDDARHF